MLKAESKAKGNRLESIRDAHNVRKEEHTDRMEDYLEVIYELMQQKGYATAVDISKYLNVSSPSVTACPTNVLIMPVECYNSQRPQDKSE